jgi:predicted dehydrogenase
VNQNYLERPAVRTCRIVGTQGRIDVDLITNTFIHFDEEGIVREETEFTDFSRNDMFMQEMRAFLYAAETRRQADVTLEDGAVSLRMALAAKRSLETGTVVSL